MSESLSSIQLVALYVSILIMSIAPMLFYRGYANPDKFEPLSFGWGDEVIDMKTRSMMNLSMIGALGKMHEWEIHCRGAITNGVSKEEFRAIIHVIGIYCGVPQALECFRVAKKILEEKNL